MKVYLNIDGEIKEVDQKQYHHINGQAYVRYKNKKHSAHFNEQNIAYIALCGQCGRKAQPSIYEQQGVKYEKFVCFHCKKKIPERMKNLIDKSLDNQEFKEAGGFTIAEHPVYGIFSFAKNVPPHNMSISKGKPVTKNWLILKTFIYDGHWFEYLRDDFFKVFRKEWKEFFSVKKTVK